MSSETHSYDLDWDRTIFLYVNEPEDLITNIGEANRTKIVLLEKGRIILSAENGIPHMISAPALLFINERSVPSITIQGEMQATALYFHPSALNDALSYEALRNGNQENQVANTLLQDSVLLFPVMALEEYEHTKRWLYLSPASLLRAKKLFQKIQRELLEQKDYYWPCRSRSYFIELLIFITSLYEESSTTNEEELPEDVTPFLQAVLQYIHINYENHITLELLAKEFGANRNQLNLMFREQLNATPKQYLIEYRIHVARSLLANTELPITEVALRSGFCDLSHFCRTFRRYMKCSPVEYRDKNS